MTKNLLKVPRHIVQRLATFDQDDVVAATVKLVLPTDIARYTQLGISLNGDDVGLPDPQPPSPAAGRYSNANLYGMEKVRRDLPKNYEILWLLGPLVGIGELSLRFP